MRKWMLLTLILGISILNAVTIYEIQYTTNVGEGTYPSPLSGQYVTTNGVCIGVDFNSNGYFLSMPEGGAWKSVFIYDSAHNPTLGDMIELHGQVWEYNGLTEIKNVTNYQVQSTGNAVPEPVLITTQAVNSEAYESVYCRVSEVSCTETLGQYFDWQVSDGSGNVMISSGFFNQSTLSDVIQIGQEFTFIKGIVSYSYGIFRLNPRNATEVQVSANTSTISIPDIQGEINSEVIVNLNVGELTIDNHYSSYCFDFNYDSGVLNFINTESANTLSAIGTVSVSNQTGNGFLVQFTSNGFITGSGLLLKLRFSAIGAGTSPLVASNFLFNETTFNVISGECFIPQTAGSEQADTITVIQRPLPNIPSICIPGELIKIECVAPQSTQAWNVFAIRKASSLPMVLNSAVYENNPPRWVLTATVPNVPLFEQYDLKVTASGGIEDISKKSMKIIPSRKTNYYFAHITDIHMPTHIFWPDEGYDTDSTETVDFREVIKDLNLLRPEFVLLTGDIVNQGENEDLDNLQWYSKAQRLLLEFEVPVYLVVGNHDVGGWDEEPPSDGTARRDWWKFFGWSWLNNPSTSYQYHTQDYSFDYGPIHFTGMEAYDNYDNWWEDIYGTESFTAQQMNWLQSDLNSTTNSSKVLFYHYDFSDQIDLSALGVSMGLWGHIHSDQGSITQQPYNLATAATCDGRRAYRIIQVNNAIVTPFATCNAGASGNTVKIDYYPSNSAFADSVRAVIVNNQALEFDNALVKFNMPPGNSNYSVLNGAIEQIERTPQKNVCYVRAHLLAMQTVNVVLWENGTPLEDNTQSPELLTVSLAYPNPFKEECNVVVKAKANKSIQIGIYNIKGEKIKTESAMLNGSGKLNYIWNGKNQNNHECPNGVYFIRVETSERAKTVKVLLLK